MCKDFNFPQLPCTHHAAWQAFCIFLIHFLIHPLKLLLPKLSTPPKSHPPSSFLFLADVPTSFFTEIIQVSRVKQGQLCALKNTSYLASGSFSSNSILLPQTRCASYFLKQILQHVLCFSTLLTSQQIYIIAFSISVYFNQSHFLNSIVSTLIATC